MVIETERLILREYSIEDVPYLVDGLNNFDIAKNLTVPYPYTTQDAINYINKFGKHIKDHYCFAICLKEDNVLIGGTGLDLVDNNKKGKGGIWLNQKYMSKGYGTEAFRARAKFAFETLNVDMLENGFFDFNEISYKMQKKLGYKKVGEKTNFCPALDSEVKEIVTTLTKEDFYEFNI